MNTTNNDLELVLNCIMETSKTFLENDMNIQTTNILNCTKSEMNNEFSALRFKGFINIICIISIDQELLKEI